jgi:hypothetical protein
MTAAHEEELWRACNTRRSVYRIVACAALASQLRVAPAEIEERATFAHCAALDLRDEDRVITGWAVVHQLALEMSHRVIE